MDAQSPTHPLAFLTLGAAAAALSRLGLPQGLAVSAALAAALFVTIRRQPVRQHLGAAALGAAVVVLSGRLLHPSIAGLLMTLVALGVVGGAAIGWRGNALSRPGFRFLREDFFEFCGFVGVLAAFPAVLAFGVSGAADWVGRLAFDLAFVGSWVLLPMSASAYAVGRLARTRREARTAGIASVSAGSLLVAALSLAAFGAISAQTNVVHDPDRALLVTSDLPNFWRAYDRAQHVDSPEERARIYLDTYIRPGSAGLHDWTRERLESGAGMVAVLVKKGWSEERLRSGRALTDSEKVRLRQDTSGMSDLLAGYNLDAAVRHRPRFFAAIRPTTLAVDTAHSVKDAVRRAYHRLADLYPEAAFPPVYFVIGQLTSGGTVSDAGQLIGMEMHARTPDTPVDELSQWERQVVGPLDAVPGIVAHELIHSEAALARAGIQQAGEPKTLLAKALDEGCASFLGQLISNGTIANANGYGLAHEAELWREFQREMNGTNTDNWLYQGDRSKDRPADLGYFVGARICQSYYEHATDKHAAVAEILRMKDPAAFVRQSGYAP